MIQYLCFLTAEQRWSDHESATGKFRSRLNSDDSELVIDDATGKSLDTSLPCECSAMLDS